MNSKSKTTITKLSTLRDVFKNIRRSPYQSLLIVLALTFTFYATTIFTITAVSANQVIEHLESQPQVTAFFNEPPSEAELSQLRSTLESLGDIKQITYVSQDEAFEVYTLQNQDNPYLLEDVSASILPASLEVSTNHPASLNQVAQQLVENELISEVVFQQEVIDEFLKWTNSIKQIGQENIAFLAILSFLFIFVIMGMKISLKRREIYIMKLVGSTRSYIQQPFIIEALIYGLLGAFFGWLAAYTRLLYATPFLLNLFSFLDGLPSIFDLNSMFLILGVQVGIACLWSATASWLAVSRYLSRHF